MYDIEGNTFTHAKVITVYILLFLLNIGNNLDHGAIPVAIPVMKKDLNVNQQQLGWLGSLVFFGLMSGSLLATHIVNKIPYKYLMFISYIGNAAGLILFPTVKVYYIQCFCRYISGFCQVSILISSLLNNLKCDIGFLVHLFHSICGHF